MLRSRQAAPSVDEDREAVVAWLDQVAARVDQLDLTSLPVPKSVRQVEVHAPLLAGDTAEPLFEPIVIEASPEPAIIEPAIIDASPEPEREPNVIEPVVIEPVAVEPIVIEPVEDEVRGHAHAELRLVPAIEEPVVDEPAFVEAPAVVEPEPLMEPPVVDEPDVAEPAFTALPTLRSLAADYEPRLEQLREELRRARGKRDERVAKERLRLLHDEYRAAKRAVRTAG